MPLINNILEFIFPPREDTLRIRVIDVEQMRAHYQPHFHDAYVSLASYKDPIIRACVRELKFHNNEHAAKLLGALLAEWVRTNVNEEAILIPIPLASRRRRERGYNQVTRIARYAKDASTLISINEGVLRRTKNTSPQSSLPRAERHANVADAFSIVPEASDHILGKRIILLDDVCTTGATMRAAANALHGRSLTCLAIAH